LTLPKLSSRITRYYRYELAAPGSTTQVPNPFDTALLNLEGTRRQMFCMYRDKSNPSDSSPC
jgi:hypothetical protein